MVEKKPINEDLKRTKEDLADLEMYIEEFSTFLPLPVCTVNPVERIIDVNKAFEGTTHYRSIEIVGESLKNIFLEKEKVEEMLKEARLKEEITTRELILISKEKKEIPVRVSVSIRRDELNNFIGHFISLTDITEVKKFQEEMEDKIKERTKELQERVEELEKFKKLTEGRELRMVELKEEIAKLKKELEK